MGIMAGQKRTNLVYIVSYLLMSVLALAAIGLLLIFAATGLARDSDAPHGYFVDQEVMLLFFCDHWSRLQRFFSAPFKGEMEQMDGWNLCDQDAGHTGKTRSVVEIRVRPNFLTGPAMS